MRLRNNSLRRCAEVLFAFLIAQLLACGTVRVAGFSQPSNVVVTTGTVSFVGFSVVGNSNGTTLNVTAVTLLVPLGSRSITLCGDQRPSFVVNSTVQMSFTEGPRCSDLVNVIPI